MKQGTLKRINSLVVNYLSIVGLWNGKHIDQNNPVVMYFMSNVLMNNPLYILSKDNPIVIEDSLEDSEKYLTMNIPPSFFHIMIKELYDIYEKLDDVNNHQNPEVRELLIRFIGSEHSFKEYIDAIMRQYKESFYDLVIHYNSQNSEYNSIRIKVLGDKLMECIQDEDYMEAAKIRDRINTIKEKGK